jgi:hypothetical protein
MSKNTFKKTQVKDLYKAIQNGEMNESKFKNWLMWYRYKHWGIGVDDAKAGKIL